MFLFRSKIDAFSSFTINLGPLYVERVFDSLLTKQGTQEVGRMGATERFERYLEYLRQNVDPGNRIQYAVSQFYKGHFYNQLANHSTHSENARHFREKALCYYQTYLELLNRNEESKYYAQWQMGTLQNLLKYPWPMVEDSLQKACSIDPSRGEALKHIISYHVRNKEWKKAYHFSCRAMNNFFDKNPVATRRWFIDFDAYNWNVVNTHLTICYKLGYQEEAEKAFDQMLAYKLRHLDEFKNNDIRHLHTLERIFHPQKTATKTA